MSEENYMTTLTEVIGMLRAEGFTHDFIPKNGRLALQGEARFFEAGEVVIERIYRFEGDSSADDEAVLYAVTVSGDVKGILIDAFGTYEDSGLEEILKNARRNLK